MSSLPQRKKTAEEIAQLRESLGVSPSPAATPHPSAAPHAVAAPQFAAAPHAAAQPSEPQFAREWDAAEAIPRAPRPIKHVRSLKKSERAPIEIKPVQSNEHSKLPTRRRSHEELVEMKHREALALLDQQAPNPKLIPAHPAWIAPGYLFAIGGASCFVFDEFPWIATAACVGCALIIALSLYLKRPISKHHAGFIAVISLFVTVFGSLHYFPQLQHAT